MDGLSQREESSRSAFIAGFAQLFDLTADELAGLSELEQPSRRIPARRTLIEAGRPYDCAYIIQSGWLIEYKMLRNGKRQVLNFRLPGEIAAIDSLAYVAMPHSVATLSEADVTPLPLSIFERLQRSQPRIASALFLMTLREEAILQQWEVSLGRREASARVAHLFLELHRRLTLRHAIDGSAFSFPATQEDVADCLGLTTPYVNRIVQSMRKAGHMRWSEGVVELLERDRLIEIAGFKAAYLDHWGASKGLGSEGCA